MTEEDIVEGCKKKNNSSQKELFKRYSKKMLPICYRYVGNQDDANDVMQEGFISVFRNIKKFNYMGEGSLRGWISRIMINKALEFIRKNNAMNFIAIEEERYDYEDAEEENPELVPPNILLEMIAELPTGYRSVFNLYALEEKTHKEIAELLNINVNSSTSQFYRARKLLAEKINNYLKNNANG